MTHYRIFKRLALTMCLLAIATEGSTATLDESDQLPVTAIWRVQQVEFNFRTHHIYYSCDGLKRKIAAILTAVGARKGIDIDMPCRVGALTNNELVLITLAAPIEATPENVEAATTYSTEQRLAARVKGVRLPSANDVERFTAEWRRVDLHTRKIGIDAGDCDLLHDLSTQVFPQVGVKLDQHRFGCPGSSLTRVRPKLRVMALVAAPEVPVAYVTEGRAGR